MGVTLRFAADIGSPGGELDAKRTEGWFLIPGLRAILFVTSPLVGNGCFTAQWQQ